MAGHQPELFHAGVWIKNFVLNHLARRYGATPIHLIVDNDIVKSSALHVPVFGPQAAEVHSTSVAFDNWPQEIPYEERTVRDEELFHQFPQRSAEITKSWGFDPMLPEFWEEVRRQAKRTTNLGERFEAARRTLERRWGCHNFEVPVSALCRTAPFVWFACHLLANAARFQAVYNDCLRAYRKLYRIRSRHHPVPDLEKNGAWLELPFWAWRSEKPRREPLWILPGDQEWKLRAGSEAWPAVASAGDERSAAAWQALEKAGYKVRCRALTTTIYARLFLADVFLHGIGGAKYDELTDEIIRTFYGVQPPHYMVLSATLLLPFQAFPVELEEKRRWQRHLRDLHWNPQRHLNNRAPSNAEAASLAAQKAHWIGQQPADKPGRRERFHALKNLSEQLRPFLAGQEQELQRKVEEADRASKANAILQNREHAFCLFPEAELRSFFSQFL